MLADRQRHLSVHEREADAKLEEEITDVLDEPSLEFPLQGVLVQSEEVKAVGITGEFLGKVGLRCE